MAKYYGYIGFAINYESEPGIWKDEIRKIKCPGDIVKNMYRRQNGSNIVDDIVISNTISIVTDSYATGNLFNYIKKMDNDKDSYLYDNPEAVSDVTIVYVELFGKKWRVISVEVFSPRLLIHLGGVYNEE